MPRLSRLVLLVLAACLAAAVSPAANAASPPTGDGRIGPSLSTTANGRVLSPAGRLTTLGDFPTGSALTPDGRFLWAVDSGHGKNDVKVVAVGTGAVVQTLPLPGSYGGVAFAPDGRRAYVSGEPKGSAPPDGPTRGDAGDAVHVFAVAPDTGRGTELDPIDLSQAPKGGSAQRNSLPPVTNAFPEGLAVSPDGATLAVVLGQADQLALVDLASRAVRYVHVGAYPAAVAFDPRGPVAYVTNQYDGTVSVVSTTAAAVTAIIGVGGPQGDRNAHPEGLVADRSGRRLYVAVTNRDAVAVVDLVTGAPARWVSVARPEGVGTAPVALALAPDGSTLYAADSGEDAIAAIALTARPGVPALSLLGRIPTAAYPTDVKVTPDGRRLVWLAGKGLGAGPNPDFVFAGSKNAFGNVETPYGSYVADMLLGRAGVLARPTDRDLAGLTATANRQVRPANATPAPAGTPLRPGGPIRHVFYVVRENRTYDQVFGSEPRGDGDPKLELFDDNGVGAPTGGVTPNAHALARTFPLLDHVYADSEVSVDGHIITAGAYAIDYVQKALHANYSDRGRAFDFGIFPVTFPPNGFIFDQAVRQGVSFRDYGEVAAGNTPAGNDGRPTYGAVVAGTDAAYPNNALIGCQAEAPDPSATNTATCAHDAGHVGATQGVAGGASRVDVFKQQFDAQVAAGTVPAFNYLILPNDHTNGTKPGAYTPQALIADNDLALGQLVDVISHSAIWKDSVIFVVEDDSQDGADHVDAHRMPAFAISPWARKGAIVHTRYDQLSVLRSIELVLGLKPLSLFDGLATPMYDAFRNDGTPDVTGTRFAAIQPEQSLTAVNTTSSPLAGLSAKLPMRNLDLVPQAILDRILWSSVKGRRSRPPRPGPGASPAEHARATGALRVLRRGGDVRRWLRAHTVNADAEDR